MTRLRSGALLLAAAFALTPALGGADEARNELAAVLAGTDKEDGTFFTLGAEYERDLSELVALSATVEVVVEGAGAREWVFVVPVVLKPWRGLKLLAGPGFERGDDETDFLFRLGAGWELPIGERLSLTPTVEFDFVDGTDGVEQAVVFGASLGFSF